VSKKIVQSSAQQSVIAIEETVSTPLSPAQRKYNSLLKKIEKQQQALREWQRTHEDFQSQIMGKIMPLQEAVIQEQRALLIVLDNYLTFYKFTKKQKAQLHDFIVSLCEALVDVIDDEVFLAIYERYREETMSEEEDEAINAILRAEFEAMFGVKLDDTVDPNDPESIMRYLFEQQNQHREADEAEAPHHTQASRKKTAKQLAKEAKEQAEAQAAQQSIQSIYRDLVKTLHPDRESDPVVREQKTQLMQEVTVAYEEKNLIRLLELQHAQTQISQPLNQLSDDRVKAFIRLLEQQLQQIKDETEQIQDRCRMSVGLSPYESLTPSLLQRCVKSDIATLTQKSLLIRKDRCAFEKDINYLKAWLKDI